MVSRLRENDVILKQFDLIYTENHLKRYISAEKVELLTPLSETHANLMTVNWTLCK